MKTMANRLSGLHRLRLQLHTEDSGQDLVEYALIAVLIALTAVVGMGSVAKGLNDIFSSVAEKIQAYIT